MHKVLGSIPSGTSAARAPFPPGTAATFASNPGPDAFGGSAAALKTGQSTGRAWRREPRPAPRHLRPLGGRGAASRGRRAASSALRLGATAGSPTHREPKNCQDPVPLGQCIPGPCAHPCEMSRNDTHERETRSHGARAKRAAAGVGTGRTGARTLVRVRSEPPSGPGKGGRYFSPRGGGGISGIEADIASPRLPGSCRKRDKGDRRLF